MRQVIVYTDGACSGNPGPGGWGYIVLMDAKAYEGSGGEPLTTNNRMELLAVINGLEHVLSKAGPEGLEPYDCEVRTDSQYVRNGITAWMKNWKRNGWRTTDRKPVKNRELWERLDMLAAASRARFTWVEGHAGEPMNERCDELARSGIPAARSS